MDPISSPRGGREAERQGERERGREGGEASEGGRTDRMKRKESRREEELGLSRKDRWGE